MSLLRDIQKAAVTSDGDLPTLLRKCQVLGARLGSAEFREWVQCELSGYPQGTPLPPYRHFGCISKGNFSGPFGKQLRNAPIPTMCLPEDFREFFQEVELSGPIASIQAMITQGEGGVLHEPWPADFVALVGRDIYQGMNCLEAFKIVPNAALVAVLDAVRNRVLTFALDIEALNPDAGEAEPNTRPIPETQVQQVVHNTFNGPVQNVATGNSGSVFQVAGNQHQNDAATLAELLKAIQSAGVPAPVQAAFTLEIQGMASNIGGSGFRDHYLGFIGMLADHMQVLGPVVAPFLPELSAMMPGS